MDGFPSYETEINRGVVQNCINVCRLQFPWPLFMILAPNLFADVDDGGSRSVEIDVVNVVIDAVNMFAPSKLQRSGDFERENAKRRYFQVIGSAPGFNHLKISSFSFFLLRVDIYLFYISCYIINATIDINSTCR